MAHEVFVCYANKEIKVAVDVCTALETSGIECWMAPRDILAGEDWDKAITKALSKSIVLVLIFSANSNISDYCINEVNIAFDNKQEIIPFFIDSTIPSGAMQLYLKRKQWLYANTLPLEPHLKKLVDEVTRHLAQIKVREEAAAKEKERLEAEAIRIAREAEEKVLKEAEKAAREKEQRDADLAQAKKEAEEARLAREAAIQAKKEAAEARLEKEREETEAAKARKEAEEARKARAAAIKARGKTEKAAEAERKAEKKRKPSQTAPAIKEPLEKTQPEEIRKEDSGAGKKRHKYRTVFLIIGIILAISALSVTAVYYLLPKDIGDGTETTPPVTTTPAAPVTVEPTTVAAPPETPVYMNIKVDRKWLDTQDVTGDTKFLAHLSGSITCLEDTPDYFSGVRLCLQITAVNLANNKTYILGPDQYFPLNTYPVHINETTEFTLDISLVFPLETDAGSYNINVNVIKVAIFTGGWQNTQGYLDFTGDLELGKVNYTNNSFFKGHVRDAVTNANIVNAYIDVWRADQTVDQTISYSNSYSSILKSSTDESGYYQTEQFTGLGPFVIRVVAEGYGAEWFDDTMDYKTATSILFDYAGQIKTIDFKLVRLGSISGKVIADVDGQPVVGVTVIASDAVSRVDKSSTTTNEDGSYVILNLTEGNYIVRTNPSANKKPYADEYYDNVYQYYNAKVISVGLGQIISNINFSLGAGASISGKITADAGGAGISGVNIWAMDGNSGAWLTYAVTSTDGAYSLSNLAPGSYIIKAVPSNTKLAFADEYYPNTLEQSKAQKLTVTANQAITGIDLSLAPGGTISGTVRNADGSSLLANVSVECQLNNGTFVAGYGATTDSEGKYTLYGLPYGTYYVQAPANGKWGAGDHDYVTEYYPEKNRPSRASLITVSAGSNPTNIDFTLTTGWSVSGKAVSSTTQQGIGYLFVMALDYDTGEMLSMAITNNDGSYTIHGLPAGNYRIQIYPRQTGLPYAEQYYKNRPSYDSATLLTITAGKNITNIDFSLTPTGTSTTSKNKLPLGLTELPPFVLATFRLKTPRKSMI